MKKDNKNNNSNGKSLKKTDNSNNHISRWHKLDNTAVIFPVISNKDISNVYRISVTLTKEINKEILQLALDNTLPWFRTFNVKLKKGFFWYYFETNNKKSIIEEEKYYPCRYFDKYSNNGFLFRVSYFKKRINLEVFHSITDGTGALDFLKVLVYNYIKLDNTDKFNIKENELIPEVDFPMQVEDSYKRNFKDVEPEKYSKAKSYKINEELLPDGVVNVIHGHIKLDKLLNYCRNKKVTITEYLTAVYLYSIYKGILLETETSKNVSIYIPVNLRKIFESDTNMNFFSFISIDMHFYKTNMKFEEILEEVQKQFKDRLTKENLEKKLSYNVSKEKNIFIRLVPLFIKNLGIKFVYLESRQSSTTTISNLGKIDILEKYKEYIDYFSCTLNPARTEPIKCAICSYGNDLVITFSSLIENTYIERSFFRKLAEDGIDDIVLESNGVYNEKM